MEACATKQPPTALRSVLVVDDDARLLEAVQRHYRKNFEITTALGPAQALLVMEQQGPFAVVVSDFSMPEMNGVELLCQVRERWPDTVRILLTGNSELKVAVDAVNQGEIFRFLNKPCPEAVFTTTINVALRQYRERLEELQRADSNGGGLVVSVSHELQAPLAVIRASAEILSVGTGLDKGTRDEFLSNIVMESERLSRLIRMILDNVAVEAGDNPLNLGPVDLNEVITSSVSSAANIRDRFRVELDLDLPEDRALIRGDFVRLQQVVGTLLGNALKMTPRSGRVEISLQPSAKQFTIWIADRGPGIPDADKARLFEPLARREDVMNSGPQSPGLGFALTKDIVEMHGGRIRCEDNTGGGSVFVVELPRTEEPQ